MFKKLTLEQFVELAKEENKIAVFQEVSGDRITPISAFEALGDEAQDAAILESGSVNGVNGRYSFICLDPIAQAVDFVELRKQLAQYHCHTEHPLSKLIGGAVGFVSYDAIRLFEDIPDSHPNQDQLPDVLFKFYRTNIAFDHQSRKVVISTLAEVNADAKQAYDLAFQKIEQLIAKIFTANSQPNKTTGLSPNKDSDGVQISMDDEYFKNIVQKAKQYIVAGDIFQVVLSRCFRKKYSGNPFDIYRALRITNPSPYMFYLEHDGTFIIGSSPEKLVSIENGIVESHPIAGTRPRGQNAVEDAQLAKDLLADEKEIAEHTMLVDLARNDIGAVCKPGSVKVKDFKMIRNFSRVMHIASVVEGTLSEDKDALDALQAAFPAGTLSGAPKIRAMEIIDELETSRRGLYGGAICHIDNQGNLDSCIAIRMAVLKDGVATVQAGAGIVYDSDPQTEAEETRHKVKAVLEAIQLAEGGLQ